jgi:hypothetical protein
MFRWLVHEFFHNPRPVEDGGDMMLTGKVYRTGVFDGYHERVCIRCRAPVENGISA